MAQMVNINSFKSYKLTETLLDQAMSLPDCTDTHDIFFENFSAFQEVLRFALGQANFCQMKLHINKNSFELASIHFMKDESEVLITSFRDKHQMVAV